MEEQGKVCSKCGVWKPLEEYCKYKRNKDGRCSYCKECQKEYKKQWEENNKERIKEYNKQYHENNKERIKEQKKQWEENNKEHRKEYKKERSKQWYENNKEHRKEYYENNKERIKEYYENNKEYVKEYKKQWYDDIKEKNLQYISNLLEQINPIFKQLNLPVYGYVYMFENTKTGHKYIGQSIQPIDRRYTGGVVKGWIKERLDKSNQKFTEELIKEDIVVTGVLDVAFCQYHLDKLETYYIDKYDSYNNGYNNTTGNHITDDGLEEFEQILKNNGLEFIDGKLVKIA